MTDEKIRALAKETLIEKYCKLFSDNGCLCDEDCPLLDIVEMLHCEKEIYIMAFVDGFKEGFKKGKDSMSDYIIELQHAAYND